MAGTLDFAGMVPGLDFLQTLMKGSAAATPPLGQWIAPTLDPAELEKRITELRTVQFWLEQNAKLLGASIQALEVQRMTLATLQTMNLPMSDLRDALKIKPQAAAAQPPANAQPGPAAGGESAPAPGAAAAPAVDPLQWWGALTQQFTDIAAKTLQQGAAEAAKLAPGAPSAKTAKPATKPADKPAAPRAAAKARASVATSSRRPAAR